MSETKISSQRSIALGDDIRALQASRLLNADLTLREIVVASQRIPGLGNGGGSPVAWELVTRDFVYKGDIAIGATLGDKQISALQESKVLNFDITLGEIVKMSSQIPGFGAGGGSPIAWELISRDRKSVV